MDTSEKEISILGCGWYGLAMAKKLIENGYTVKGSTTTPEKQIVLKESGIIPYLVNFQQEAESFDVGFFSCPILIVCIPPKRSSAEQHTFLSKITKIADAASTSKVSQLIFISSTSVYGDINGQVDENMVPQPDTDSGKAILSAELLLKDTPGFMTTIIRFGGLIGPNRDPGRFFAGKSDIPNGNAPVNLIHLSDCTGITLSILQNRAFGYTYNACSPQHPGRSAFYTEASVKSGLERPHFKDELLNWKQVNSITIPKILNYDFVVKLNSIVIQ
ncbi:SDR family oxidoreductase [Pedobacter hartonius]|uniref:Nucleoside-diphosphate-sugar epimerase n=1 Tax=Pedobacter hartonius TaxID=425514 RepID=A0A1H4B310_9SPHI|nr:SDR family oxidoreductase [Pedobacter hartonius]SEA42511.1 Nucleoside-diphosphate-sugar epimerase [Pedobacter hartonius]